MVWYIYILFSDSLKSITWVAQNSDLKDYDSIEPAQNQWTKQATDWKEVYSEKVQDRKLAFTLEKRIKKRGATRYLKDHSIGACVSL